MQENPNRNLYKKNYDILLEGGSDEIIEKKSRFIAHTAPIESEAQALAFVETIKKKYWDARHNCYAFSVGSNHELLRFSDDGEPGGTAGKPILNVIQGEDIHNLIIVVTRYFGGILLGTGGLVRAYSKAAQEGLAASRILTKKLGWKYEISTDYQMIGKIQYVLASLEIITLDTEYTENVKLIVLAEADLRADMIKKVTEVTNGTAIIEESECLYFGCTDKETLLFPIKSE